MVTASRQFWDPILTTNFMEGSYTVLFLNTVYNIPTHTQMHSSICLTWFLFCSYYGLGCYYSLGCYYGLGWPCPQKRRFKIIAAGCYRQDVLSSAQPTLKALIDRVVVLCPTRHKIGDVPPLAWYGKTKPNTTKAHIHQSKEMYYSTK